jgi:HSP20 family protein
MFMRSAVTHQAHAPGLQTPLHGSWSQPAPIPMDAWREDDRLVIALDLPGIPPEAVEVEASGHLVTVRAERRPAPRGPDARTELAERAHGVFARRIQLAHTVDADRIQAHLEAGVLTLTVPVSAVAQPRRIAVECRETQEAPAAAGRPGAAAA